MNENEHEGKLEDASHMRSIGERPGERGEEEKEGEEVGEGGIGSMP